MKRNLLKSVSLAICVALFVCVLSVATFVTNNNMTISAEETHVYGDWTYSLGTNGCTILSYNGKSSDVVIPASINGYKVGVIGKKAFINNFTMQTVTIPETITSIEAEAFVGCAGLSQINFNAKNATVPSIWRYDGNRGVGVFSGAGSAAVSLKVKFGSKVTKVPENLFNTDYENGYDYAHVTAVEFSSSILSVGVSAFEDCRDLGPVSIGANVATLDTKAFFNCTALTKVRFKDELQSIGDSAFEGCTSLVEIIWGEGLDSIGNYTFKGCSNLKEVNIPKPTTTIGRQAFADTIRLEKVTIPSSVVTMSSEVFYNAIKLSQLNFNAKNATVPSIWRYDEARGVGVFTGAGSGTTSFKVIFGSSVQVVPANLFNTDYENGYDYAHVTSVQFSSSVKTIGDSAFEDCLNLGSVTTGKNISEIKSRAFFNCTGIKTVKFNDVLQYIGDCAFENCTLLKEITWGKGLDSIGNYTFKGCSNLREANIPSPTTTIGRQAFANDIRLEKVTIPTTLTSMSSEVFANTVKLSTINYNAKNATVPPIWRYDDARGVGVFTGAGSGTSGITVTFGSKVKTIPADLFNTDKENGYDFAYIKTVNIPSSVTEIGSYAFDDCERLTTITTKTNKVTIGENILTDTPTALKIKCLYGTDMHTYAKLNDRKYSYLKPLKVELTEIKNEKNGIKISWLKAVGAHKYYVYRKSSSTGTWKLLEKLSSSKRSYIDDEASQGKTYYYTVKAYSPNEYASDYNKTGKKLEFIKAPTSVKASKVSSGIKITWKKATGAKTYKVYRSKGSGSFKKLATVTTTSYTDKAVVKGNTYKYKVYASDGSSQSVPSSTVSIKK
ncbi:MAG: leucine-rich repeat protein [Longicatena sp.]|nr:leucine-rich repeat protein [Longicatena sp.]